MEANKPFEDAYNEFRNALSKADQERLASTGPYSSVDEVIGTLKSLRGQARQRRTIHKCLDIFKRLNDRLKTYFDALNVLAGCHEFAGLAYGSLRVVLQVLIHWQELVLRAMY